MAVSNETLERVKAKLSESGLTLDDAKQLGLEFYDNGATLDPGFDPCPGIRFWYKEMDGSPMVTRKGEGGFWRVRQLPGPKAGFDAQTTGKDADGKKKKDNRYLQPKGTRVGVYFPDIGIDWLDVGLDPAQSIIITEGEFKSAAVCKAGIPCVGLGGVWNFKSKADGVLMVEQLEAIDWRRRRVYVVYDSDATANPNIIASINEIAEQLFQRGADVWYAQLEAIEEGGKTGLDDFLEHHGAAGPEMLRELLRNTPHRLSNIRKLWEMNARYAHISHEPAHSVLDLATGKVQADPDKWAKGMSAQKIIKMSMNREGELVPSESNLAREWLEWPMHTNYEYLDYDPNHPAMTPIDDRRFNSWPGMLEPKEGDVGPLHRWRELVFGDDLQAWNYFLQWHAYKLQNPGAQYTTAILLTGAQGSGKSMFANAMQHIYGENFSSVDAHTFFSAFNPWADRKQYVMANEVFTNWSREDRARMTMLKDIVDRKWFTLNRKHQQERHVKNFATIFMTANPIDALHIESDDRRYFVYRTVNQIMPEDFMIEWHEWLGNGGPAALMAYLLKVDVSKFSPYAKPPMTKSKQDVMDYNESERDQIARNIVLNGPEVLGKYVPGDLFIMENLFSLLPDGHQRTLKDSTGLRRALIDAGAIKVPKNPTGGDGRIKVGPGMHQIWAVRNHDKWAAATVKDIRAHVIEHDPKLTDVKEKY